jgi:hypothetical protein
VGVNEGEDVNEDVLVGDGLIADICVLLVEEDFVKDGVDVLLGVGVWEDVFDDVCDAV